LYIDVCPIKSSPQLEERERHKLKTEKCARSQVRGGKIIKEKEKEKKMKKIYICDEENWKIKKVFLSLKTEDGKNVD
jgi:hypothetical protein